EDGVLKSYLHDRETALIFETEPTGNARAFEYTDEPIIRMTNTYILPGDHSLEEMIEDVKEGYLMRGAGGGQADSNAEFMFEVDEAYRIEKGEVKELLRGVTISGQAFDVLKSVDAIGKDFLLDIGVGYCGKFQRAKVDGGGGAVRCKAIIGGRQEG
ncbi:MAG: TldD/PmbA family protein, partial [Thermoplasmata archaeon]|nr:TldD/PmbA family protein [Thermoplasmata archaeon]